MNDLNINSTNNNICYVEDTTLLANSNEDLQKIFEVVKSTSEQKELDMNVKKPKTMVIISKNEDLLALEIEIHIAQAKSMFIQLNDILCCDILLDLRLRDINLYVYSKLLYSDETWTLYVGSTKKLEGLEM